MSNFFILFFILNWKIESNSKYNAYGGHLNSAIISGTDEIVIEEIKNTVKREFNKEVGLNLLFE
jgi:predicted DNA-binding protein with PD1-like motif